TISPKPKPSDFHSEWDWDRYYRDLSIAWLRSNHAGGVRFTLRKATNFFISIRTSPYTYTADARRSGDRRRMESAVTSTWLLAGRGLQALMSALAYRLWASGQRGRRAIVLGVAAVN